MFVVLMSVGRHLLIGGNYSSALSVLFFLCGTLAADCQTKFQFCFTDFNGKFLLESVLR